MKSVQVLIPASGRATRLADVRVPSARVSQPLVLLNGVEEPKNGRTTLLVACQMNIESYGAPFVIRLAISLVGGPFVLTLIFSRCNVRKRH